MNPIQEKMYQLLGDAGITNRNMFTAMVQADWKGLAECPDRGIYEYKLRKALIEDFCHKTSKRLVPKISDNVYGKEWRMFGFVFSETELLELMHAAYILGHRERVSPFSVGSVLKQTHDNKDAVLEVMRAVQTIATDN